MRNTILPEYTWNDQITKRRSLNSHFQRWVRARSILPHSSDKARFPVHRLVLWAFHAERLMERARECADAGETDYEYPDDFDADHVDRDPM